MNDSLRILKDETIGEIHLRPGDTLILRNNGEIVLESKIDKELVADRAVLFLCGR